MSTLRMLREWIGYIPVSNIRRLVALRSGGLVLAARMFSFVPV